MDLPLQRNRIISVFTVDYYGPTIGERLGVGAKMTWPRYIEPRLRGKHEPKEG